MNFLEALKNRILLADGGMGTRILAQGVGYDESYELLNLTRPQLIAGIHREFALAGADVIEANTFGANRVRQEQYGLQNRVAEMNDAAVKLARAAARPGSFVAGSMGPLGARIAPLGSITRRAAFEAFHEQAQALEAAGMDLFQLETFSDLAEIEQAIRAVRAVSQKPIVALMTFGRDNQTQVGNSALEVLTRLAALGANVVGANCSTGPQRMIEVMEQMARARLAPMLGAMPNAGYPEIRADRLIYPATPRYFGDVADRFAALGLRYVGGCCGTTPEHIREMRLALDERNRSGQAQARATTISPMPLAHPAQHAPTGAPTPLSPTRLQGAFAAGEFVVTVEIEPPRSYNTTEVEDTCNLLKHAGVTVLNMADAPLAKMRLNGMVLAHRVQQRVGIETVLHFPVRGRSLLRVQSDLLGAHALDIRNLFVTMGDPTKLGDFPQANDAHDIVPTGLMQLLSEKFNTGVDQAGTSIGQPCGFVAGCALNLTPATEETREKEAALLKKKIDFGASFALTQPVFDVALARVFLEYYANKYGPLRLPIIAGILPLASVRHAEFFRNEVPGIVMPEGVIERMTRVGNKTRTEGALIAHEIMADLRPMIAGVYLIPAFGRFDVIAGLIERVRETSPKKV